MRWDPTFSNKHPLLVELLVVLLGGTSGDGVYHSRAGALEDSFVLAYDLEWTKNPGYRHQLGTLALLG